MGLTFIDRLKHGWNAFKDDKNTTMDKTGAVKILKS